MKKFILLFLVTFFAININSIFSQEKSGKTIISQIERTPVESPAITEIVKNITLAKSTGDASSRIYWEDKLHEITKPQIINADSEPVIFKKESGVIHPEKTLNFSFITNSLVGSSAVSREWVTGVIYATYAVYGAANADTVKILKSTNNGLSFSVIYTTTSAGLKVTYNSMDIEAVAKGDTTFCYLTMAYSLAGGPSNTLLARVRQDGLQVTNVSLIGSATNRYINPRLTSDNAVYSGGGTYIYMSLVLDSLVGGNRNIRSKLFIIKNPFNGNITGTAGYQDATNGQYSYYIGGTAPDTAKFETDIAYLNPASLTDQLYTVTIVRGVPGLFNDGKALYFTRSNDYGATAPGLFNVLDNPYFKESPRFATTGNLNKTAMVVTRRLWAGGDWDPYYFFSSDISAGSPPIFASNFVNSLSDTTMGVSVAGKQGSAGTYLFAYNNRASGDYFVFARPFNAPTLGTNVQLNPPGFHGTSSFGYPDATFRNVNNDSCYVMWGAINGLGLLATGGCSGTFTGTGDPGITISEFRLDQNYPNPFNPTTNISYNIPVSGLVKIVVYDVLGCEVATVINENKTAGYYSTSFDGKNLSSEVYYYKITFTSDNKSFSQTKKMMLIK